MCTEIQNCTIDTKNEQLVQKIKKLIYGGGLEDLGPGFLQRRFMGEALHREAVASKVKLFSVEDLRSEKFFLVALRGEALVRGGP